MMLCLWDIIQKYLLPFLEKIREVIPVAGYLFLSHPTLLRSGVSLFRLIRAGAHPMNTTHILFKGRPSSPVGNQVPSNKKYKDMGAVLLKSISHKGLLIKGGSFIENFSCSEIIKPSLTACAQPQRVGLISHLRTYHQIRYFYKYDDGHCQYINYGTAYYTHTQLCKVVLKHNIKCHKNNRSRHVKYKICL